MPNGTGIKFQNCIAPGNVLCGLKSTESFGVIAELSDLICKNTAGLDKAKVTELVLEREKLFPTVIAKGLAVPHARLSEISAPLIAVGTSKQGVDFNAGMPPVNVVMLVLTPRDNPSFHLQVLSALAKEFANPELVPKLVSANSANEILEVLGAGISELIPDHLTAHDIMRKDNIITLTELHTLSDAIKIFSTEFISDIPIVDEEKDIRGIISIEDILRLSLPEHLLWMDDLSPIIKFQPFAELLRNEKETKLSDVMRDDYISVDAAVPAIQVAKVFLMKNCRLIIVTEHGKLVGTVRIQEFIRKFFWE